MEVEWERKDFGISCVQTLLFLTEVILPGFAAYVFATIEVYDVTHLFFRTGVPSGFARIFFSGAFGHLLVPAVLTQIYSTMLVLSFARLYHTRHFCARAKAILAGLRKRTVPATFFFFKSVATVGGYVVVIPAAFRLQDVLGEYELQLMLLGGGAVYLASTVFHAVIFHRVWAVPVLEGAGF